MTVLFRGGSYTNHRGLKVNTGEQLSSGQNLSEQHHIKFATQSKTKKSVMHHRVPWTRIYLPIAALDVLVRRAVRVAAVLVVVAAYIHGLNTVNLVLQVHLGNRWRHRFIFHRVVQIQERSEKTYDRALEPLVRIDLEPDEGQKERPSPDDDGPIHRRGVEPLALDGREA